MPVVTSGATTVGAVQISGLAPNSTPIESWLNGCLQGKAFGFTAAPTPVAAQHSQAELRNPAGSGKNLWVYVATIALAATGTAYIGVNTPPLLTGGNHGQNLLTGLTSSVAFVTGNTQAALIGGPFLSLNVSAGTMTSIGQPWLIVLAPNTGLILQDFAVNDSIGVNFMWMEV